MCRWRRGSEFGEGRRVALDREQRAVWRARLRMRAYRQVGKLTVSAVQVGELLVNMLGADGRLDPCIATLATRAGVDPSTVVRALARLRECGFVTWVRRLVRDGSRVEQTSNAYVLAVPGTPELYFAQAAKPVVSSVAKRAVRVSFSDAEARENAARQLELPAEPVLAARMRA